MRIGSENRRSTSNGVPGTLLFTEYKFRKPYTANEDLCRAVNDTFVEKLATELETPYGAKTIPRSREAFVRRLVVTHIGIIYNYDQHLLFVDGEPIGVTCETRYVLGTPTRSMPGLRQAARGDSLTERIVRLLAPLCLREYLKEIRRGAGPMEALGEIRKLEWAAEARKLARECDHVHREQGAKAVAGLIERIERRRNFLRTETGDLFAIANDRSLGSDHKHVLFAFYKKHEDSEIESQFMKHFLMKGT
jgi:hypothetical protein